MIDPKLFVKWFKSVQALIFATGVPDSLLKDICIQ